MAKQLIEKNKNFKVVGMLDKDVDGNYIVTISEKDFIREFPLMNILEEMVGTEISLTSVEMLRIDGEE